MRISHSCFLNPIMKDNIYSSCITATAGTRLVRAFQRRIQFHPFSSRFTICDLLPFCIVAGSCFHTVSNIPYCCRQSSLGHCFSAYVVDRSPKPTWHLWLLSNYLIPQNNNPFTCKDAGKWVCCFENSPERFPFSSKV